MDLGRRLLYRVQRIFVYWGLLDHPYGHAYARRRYTPLGRDADRPPGRDQPDRPRNG